MSFVTEINGFDPNYFWILGALPLGLGLDLALGYLPGRSHPIRWLGRLIEVVEGSVGRTVARLGGGRGGDLFGGILLVVLVVGTVSSVVWLITDLGDTIGQLATLLVRAILIAAGLAVRSTGDQILLAAEAPDQLSARSWLELVGGHPPARFDELGVDRVCVVAVGELATSLIVAPLFWLAVGGPAAMWGFLAIRSLREAAPARRPGRVELSRQVTVTLADLAETLPAVLTWVLVVAAAGVTRANPVRSWTVGWQAGRSNPRIVPIWGQAALAGALGVRVPAGRSFIADRSVLDPWVGDSTRPLDHLAVVRAVRIMQVASFLAAGLVLLVTIVW